MSNKLFTGIPEYVRVTIYSQTSRLLSNSNFIRGNDLEDVIQDLLLFYLETFYKKKIPSEAYVVKSIQNEAKRLLKAKVCEHFGLFVSLEDMDFCPDELKTSGGFENLGINLTVSEIACQLSERENLILEMIMKDHSLKEVTEEFHISKNTIYKLFEKIKKNYKK